MWRGWLKRPNILEVMPWQSILAGTAVYAPFVLAIGTLNCFLVWLVGWLFLFWRARAQGMKASQLSNIEEFVGCHCHA
jgi:hypothetical protein